MKKRFLLLLTALFVLMTAVTVQAEVTFEVYHSVLTGDESLDKEFKTLSTADKNAFGRVGITPGTVLTVEDDGTGENYVYKLIGGHGSNQQMALNLYCSAEDSSPNDTNGGKILAGSNYLKMVARVYISDTKGTVQLFNMNSAYGSTECNDTAGVYLVNGGAYYYNADASKTECFIPNGTLEAGKWYTVEAIFDKSTNEALKMMGSVYDENGMILGTSPMTCVSNLKWYASVKSYMRTFIGAKDFAEGEYALFDNIGLYAMSELPLYAAPIADCDEENAVVTFTFEEEIDANVIGISNVNISSSEPDLDISGKYTAEVEGNTLKVDVSAIPFGDNLVVSVFGYAIDGKTEYVFDLFENAVTNVSFDSEDGEITVGDDVIATVSLSNKTGADKDYMILVTSWNSKNECIAIRNVCGNIAARNSDVVELPAVKFADEGSIIRVSFIDNWQNMTPIGDVAEFTLGGE